MKKISKVLWGIVLISVGVIFALNAFGITDIEIFFDGWWTLFIIVQAQAEEIGKLKIKSRHFGVSATAT